MNLKNTTIVISCCLFLILIISVGKIANAEEPLTLWIHPFLPSTQLITRFNPIAEYLSEKVGQPITVKISESYQSHIERVGKDKVDIAYMGPAPYVKMTRKYGKKPLLASVEVRGKSFFFGMIVVPKNSPLQSLSDLTGKSFAFGDRNSTMSHIVPRYMLMKAGVGVDTLASYNYLKAHHNVALGVLGGYYDAGALKETVFYTYEDRGLRTLAKSPPIPVHLFVTKSDFPPEIIETLRGALLDLKSDKRGPEILKSIKNTITGMMPVKDEAYDSLREIIKTVAITE